MNDLQIDYWGEEFGRGWELKKFTLQSLEPVYTPIIAYPKAWTPGIKGTVATEALYLDVKTEADLLKYTGKLKDKIILFSAPVAVKPGFTADAKRFNDSTLLSMANAGAPQESQGNFGGGNRDAQALAFAKWDFCMKEGAVAVLEPSPSARLEDGTLSVGAATIHYPPDVPQAKRLRAQNANAPKILPQVVVSDEHYNRLIRQIQADKNVKLELVLETEFTPATQGFNVVGDIPGTDLKDEVVMIGAHLDSWHGGTGATDNAGGSSVLMEAMRIIKSIGAQPRRTIRIALWGGEEQGEFDLLLALVERPQRVLTRDQLMELIYNRDAGPFDRTIDVQIGRLRKKIEPDVQQPRIIKAVRGLGYQFAVEVTRLHDSRPQRG